jgi:hypothetical protein
MLNGYVLPDDVALCGSPNRGCMLERLALEFRNAFPGIEYEIDTQTRVVNAQAFCLGGARIVRLYGGLAYHPLVNEDALIFTLLHETGHHRAQGHRFAGNPSLACDCFADRWALAEGAGTLLHRSGRAMKFANAIDSLDELMMSINGSSEPPLGRSQQPTCWAGLWALRRSQLSCCSVLEPTGPCYFSR